MASKNINERVLDVELNCLKQQSKLKRFIHRHIPVTRWLPNYSRFYGVSDFIAGITLGLTMIPQSIAYAALAGLTPQYGLYSSFLGGFIYLIFGTIKEVSIGATSLMSLVTVEYTRDMPVDFVILLCFLAGCTELLMGLMNLGFLVDFISMSVTSGFTSATSIIIIMSQLPGLLGLRFKCENLTEGFKKLYQNWRKIRFNDSVLGVSCIIFLLAFRKLKDIDCSKIKSRNKSWGQLIQKTLWFLSISRNAITVCIASFITYNHYQNGSSIFITSGSVTPGLPSFNPPPFSSQVGNVTYNFLGMCSHLGSGIIMVPLVAVLTNVAIAKAYVRDGTVEATQEMLTLGVCNIAGSFFSSMPTCGAFTRSAVGSASGIQTPMAGLYSGIMTLLALSFLTPYFSFIPKASLSAVLISAVVFLIDLKIFRILWNGSKRDMITAGSTFLISIFINVESGLLFGTLINASFLLYLSARPSITIDKCKTVYGLEYVIVKPEIGLFYPAISYLTNKINRIARKEAKGIYPVVVDFNRLQGIDYTAAKGIQGILSDFEGKSQPLIFLNVNPNVVTSIIRLSGMKNFNAVCNEDDLIDTLKNLEITEKIYKAQDSSFKELLNKSSDFTSQNEITKESVLTERESLLTSYKPSELKSTDC
ncbi:sodium-independent sulfate anion transporter-like isoform X1 [Cotesia glomerata]|uniref:sodium-independent sulfate anion transporter-like isoform X1 n=1 Tax=Cotesia glomerata TaxID=32391 RepID=UPI001D033CF3|nr:sodium-independent sulfate anion transporter-like isoform X1 [Cotesia glomerata]